jgi:glycosyltransferase involved in cell wall biosynthesis
MSAYAVVGPERHGVVIHGLRLAASGPGLAARLVRISATDPGAVADDLRRALVGHDSAMIHVTDHLLARSPAEAADLVEDLARTGALALCLHDVPQPAEGEVRHGRRRAAYRRFVQSAAVVVVASEHERTLLARCVEDSSDTPVVVLPLPLERAESATAPGPAPRPGAAQVGVLGFLYPGKGLESVIGAAATVAGSRDVVVVNVGGVSSGHESLVDDLTARAHRLGTRFTVTGYVPERDLPGLLTSVAVPVAAHRHISASGSINSWIALGRRPIVLAGAYTRELAERMPGAVTLVEDAAGLAAAIEGALDAPERTWVDNDVRLGPTWADSALAHEAVLRSIS